MTAWNIGIRRLRHQHLYACVQTWLTDFRGDLPTHPRSPRWSYTVMPTASCPSRPRPFGERTRPVKGSKLVVIGGAPHGMLWTHADEVNRALYQFLS